MYSSSTDVNQDTAQFARDKLSHMTKSSQWNLTDEDATQLITNSASHPSSRLFSFTVWGCTPAVTTNPSNSHAVALLLSDGNDRWRKINHGLNEPTSFTPWLLITNSQRQLFRPNSKISPTSDKPIYQEDVQRKYASTTQMQNHWLILYSFTGDSWQVLIQLSNNPTLLITRLHSGVYT